jgi:hypothetical protein
LPIEKSSLLKLHDCSFGDNKNDHTTPAITPDRQKEKAGKLLNTRLSPLHSYNSPNSAMSRPLEQDVDDDDMFIDFFEFDDDILVDSIDSLSISGPSSSVTREAQQKKALSDKSPLPLDDSISAVDCNQLWNRVGEMAKRAFESFNQDNGSFNHPDTAQKNGGSTTTISNALSLHNHVSHRLLNDGMDARRDSKEPCDEHLKSEFRSSSLAEWIANNVEIVYDS